MTMPPLPRPRPVPAAEQLGRSRRHVRQRNRRRLGAGFLAMIALSVVSAGMLSNARASVGPALPQLATPPSSLGAPSLSISVPESRPVDQSWPIRVTGATSRTPIQITVTFGAVHRLTVDTVTDADGAASAQVTAEHSRWAGPAEVTAVTVGAVGRAGILITPDEPVGPLTPAVGPRSIIADGVDKSEAVVLAEDQFGNAPLDGTTFDVHRLRSDGQLSTTSVTTQNLIAHIMFASATVAGVDQLHVRRGSLSSGSVAVRVVAGPPTPFEVTPIGTIPDADGYSLLKVQTGILRDTFGNVQPDGTAVTLTAQGTTTYSTMSSAVLDGRATFTITAPEAPETVRLTGICRGQQTAKPLDLTFAASGVSLPISINRVGDRVTLDVGPILDRHGVLVPDGTLVRASVDESGVLPASTPTIDGKARVNLIVPRDSSSDTVTVSALGGHSEVPLP